jgi:DNA-binding NarL/FixJ family response regulator
MYEEQHLVKAALKAGILGFVLKSSAAQDLIPAVRAALDGRAYLPVMAPAGTGLSMSRLNTR